MGFPDSIDRPGVEQLEKMVNQLYILEQGKLNRKRATQQNKSKRRHNKKRNASQAHKQANSVGNYLIDSKSFMSTHRTSRFAP